MEKQEQLDKQAKLDLDRLMKVVSQLVFRVGVLEKQTRTLRAEVHSLKNGQASISRLIKRE